MIEYEYSDDASGYKKQYIGNYGMYQREEDNFSVKAGERTNTINTLTLRNDTIQYSIDMSKKKGTSSAWDLEEIKTLTKSLTAEQKENINAVLLTQMGAIRQGTEVILGKTCEVYNMMGTMRVSLWKGIVMKSEMTMGKLRMTMTATKVETDISLEPELFLPPEDVTFTTGKPM